MFAPLAQYSSRTFAEAHRTVVYAKEVEAWDSRPSE